MNPNRKNPFAFPSPPSDKRSSANINGMTLRDYFAAKAMQGFASDSEFSMSTKEMAILAYVWADYMLEARDFNV